MKAFALLCIIAVALAAPATPAPANPPAPKAGVGAMCASSQAQIQTQLEAGIQANLDIQSQELKGIQALQKMSTGATPAAGFVKQQKAVLDIQSKGIDIRANNQKLAQQINSPAADGLAVVAKAQVTEKDQVQGLKGTTADAATLSTLVQEVQDGTNQNKKNLAAAKSQKIAA